MNWRSGKLWNNRDFMKLWAGQTVSEIGSRITREGLPFAAVYVLGASAGEMGLLAAAGTAPVLLVGLVAGVWIDRVRRRPVLIAADVGRALIVGSIPLAWALGVLTIQQVFLVAALAGALTVFFDVADNSYLPGLVGRDNLVEGNSKLGATSSLAEVGGPAITGVLVQALTAPVAILFDAISFLVSALFLGSIRKPEPPPAPREAGQTMWKDAVEGLRVVLGNRVLRALAGSTGTFNFFGGFFGALYILYASRELRIEPGIVGVLIALGGVGGLMGAFVAGRVARRLGLGTTIVGSLVTMGALATLVPLAGWANASEVNGQSQAWVVIGLLAAAQLLGDMALTVYFINEVSLRQTITPDHILGRTNATMQFIVGGVGPFGAIIGGALADLASIRVMLSIAAAGMMLGSLWLVFSPVRKLKEYPTQPQ